MTAITQFSGVYRFLSNFAPAPWIGLDGVVYQTVEAAYQAGKSNDPEHRRRCQLARTPGETKRLGRRCLLRSDWEAAKVPLMRALLLQKFSQHHAPDYLSALLQTGDAELVEGNTWGDRFWGQCPVGYGENHLGKLLMEIRLHRRAEQP